MHDNNIQDNRPDEGVENSLQPEKPTYFKTVFNNAGCGTYGTVMAIIVCIPLCFVSEAFIYFSILVGIWTLFWMIIHFVDYRSAVLLYKKQFPDREDNKRNSFKKPLLILVIVVALVFTVWFIHTSRHSSDTTTTSKQETLSHNYSTTSRAYTTTTNRTTSLYEPTPVSQRCWYCGKVIFSDRRAIHATHKYLDTYECDYCGKPNVKE